MTIEAGTSPQAEASAPVVSPEAAQSSAPAAEPGAAGVDVSSPPAEGVVVHGDPQPAAPADGPSTSLLSEGAKTEPAAVPETPATTEQAPASEPPAPTYEFVIPEGVTFQDEALTEFKSVLGEYKAPPELAQKMLDRHISEMSKLQEQTRHNQHVVWETTQNEWRDQVKADPELGGNRFETTIAAASGVVRQFTHNEAEMSEIQQALNYTGAGNHPAIVRLLARVGEALREGRPAPSAPPAQQQTRAQRRYNANGA